MEISLAFSFYFLSYFYSLFYCPWLIQAQDESMDLYLQRMDAIIQKSKKPNGLVPLNPQLIQMVPGAADSYVHCLCTLFHHSFYYHTDIALATHMHYQVAKAVWPELHYISPKLLGTDGKTFKKPKTKHVKRKIRLGIASGHFTEGSSVVEEYVYWLYTSLYPQQQHLFHFVFRF